MVVVLVGVSGSGKTAIGQLLARDPWLAALQQLIADQLRDGRSAIVACSALKQIYRDRLRVDKHRVQFV